MALRHARRGAFAALVLGSALSGCAVGPNYHRPVAPIPPSYSQEWKPAEPRDALDRGHWWEIFGDQQLNALEEQIDASNQNLKAAQAQFLQARALLRQSRSAYFPTVTAQAAGRRVRNSGNAPPPSPNNGITFNDFVLPADVSYEADAWGRIRRTVEASRASAQASAADLAAVNLSLHAELAEDYFELRGLDLEEGLLTSTVAAYREARDLTQNRFSGGVASGVDVEQAETQLQTTKAQAADLGVQRAQLEHAIAVLLGQPASTFHLLPAPLAAAPPLIPAGLPSELLERRPDIAAAERRMAAANAQIGVASSAFFPILNLTGAGGLESGKLSTWLSAPSALWSAGLSAVATLFDGGRRRAVSEQAKAAYEEAVANYRQTTLVGIQEVEDNLAALSLLEAEAKTEEAAVAAAGRSLALSTNRYKGGVTTYLEVITAQSADLSNERAAVQVQSRRMVASVLLVKALGGGWSSAPLTEKSLPGDEASRRP
jgi:NodT family efflux transporter outer membrane factor (OMF) lipoprotein